MDTTSISQFEMTKPVITMKKINELIEQVQQEQLKTENLYRDRVASLDKILTSLFSLRSSFKNGE